MKNAASPCSEGQLHLLLHGGEHEDSYRCAAEHLETCTSCQSRLAELAELNYERLGLEPFAPEQFALVGQVAFPPDPTELIVDGIIETRGTLEGGESYP